MFKYKISNSVLPEDLFKTVGGKTVFDKIIDRDALKIPEPQISNTQETKDSDVGNSSYTDIEAYICFTDALHINLLNTFNRIKFPEINYYIGSDGILKDNINEGAYVVGTNDGLLIFNFGMNSTYAIVYDLFMDDNPNEDNLQRDTFEFIESTKDISNQIYMIEHLKEVNPRVHKLNIVNGEIVPEVKFIDSDGKKHYFIDMYIPSTMCDIDEYGYYYNDKTSFNFDTITTATFLKTSQVLVSDTKFDGIDTDRSYYTTTKSNNDLFSISFTGYSGDVYICV